MSDQPSHAFTVFVLLYGDEPQLAARCLGPRLLELAQAKLIDLRIGMNACGKNTDRLVRDIWGRGLIRKIYKHAENKNKYPVMREMFHDPSTPITTPYVMWFDDDSCLVNTNEPAAAWLQRVFTAMDSGDQIGSIYTMALVGNQHLWMQNQSWYTGNPVLTKGKAPRFITGGWWVLRSELIQRYNWPIPELNHNGGDLLLSQILQQQGYKLKQFNTGVWINADDNGKESGAKRRGTDHGRTPIGWNFEPGQTPVLPSPVTAPVAPKATFMDLDL